MASFRLKFENGLQERGIAVTHNPEEAADAILVINHGEIIERGTHQALLEERGFYYNLYISQYRGVGRDDAF